MRARLQMGVLVFGAIGRLDALAHGKEYCLNYNMDFILAHSRYRRGRFEEAIQTCDELLSKNSKDEAAWVLKCQCLVRDNYIDELETEEEGMAQQLIKDNDKNNLARAGTSFKNAAAHNPVMRPLSSGRINTGYQRVGTSMASRAGSKAQNNMLRTGRIMTKGGVAATSNGRVLRLSTASLEQHGEDFFDSSKVDLRKVAQRKSKARTVYLYLFYVEHNLKKALELATYATETNSYQDPWWKLALAKCYYHLSFYPEAEKQLLSSVKHNNNIQSYLYLSRIYQKQDNVEKSVKTLRDAISIHPYEPKLHVWIGRIYDDLGELEKSHEEYQSALSLENCNIEAVANIASYFYYKDQAEVSLKLYQRLIELGYDSPEVWNNLALCCFSNGQYDAFYTCFEYALRLAEDDPELFADVWYNIGNIYSTIGEIDMAIHAYQLTLTHIPNNVESLNNLGVIYWRKGEADSAINYGEKSFRASPNFQAAYNLSLWYFQAHQYEKSHKYNQETLLIYPNHTESLLLKSRLLRVLDTL